ncbi:MAG: hypothetical protein HZA53_09515 [Planctomycetes bacterium]|nr:hypothetical protein [Planctomycetota bacterium]
MLHSFLLAFVAAFAPASNSTQLPSAPPVPQDGFATAPGYQPIGSAEIPAFSVIAPMRGARTLVFDGEHFDVIGPNGALVRRLATLPSFVFPSFVVVAPSGVTAYAGESSNDALYAVDLFAGGATQVGSLHFNYAACFASADELLLSASPCGFSCGSELFALDLATHALTQRGQLPGASGPLALTDTGELLYGFQANAWPQPGELWIGEWSAQQLANATPLTRANSTKFAQGFDGLSSIAADARGGHVFAAVGSFVGPTEIAEFDALGRRLGTVASSSLYVSNLVVETRVEPGALQPVQPRGARLHWIETDFYSTPSRSFHRVAEPVRPFARIELDATGRRVLRASGAPADTYVSLALARMPHALAVEHAEQTGSGLVFTMFSILSASAPIARTDARGELAVLWPAPYTGKSVIQLFYRDATGRVIATSAPVLD